MDDSMDIDLSLEELIERKKLEHMSSHPQPTCPREVKLPFTPFSRTKEVSQRARRDLGRPLGELVKRDQHLPEIRHQKQCYRKKGYLYSRDDYPPARYGRVYGYQLPAPLPRDVNSFVHRPRSNQGDTILFQPFAANATNEHARDMFQTAIGPVETVVLGVDWVEVTFVSPGDGYEAIKQFDGKYWMDTNQRITVTPVHRAPARSYGVNKRVSAAKRGGDQGRGGRMKGRGYEYGPNQYGQGYGNEPERAHGQGYDQGYGRGNGAGHAQRQGRGMTGANMVPVGVRGNGREQGQGRGMTGTNMVPVGRARRYGY